MDVSASPLWMRYSPGAQKLLRMCNDNSFRHPCDADSKIGSCSISRCRCMETSPLSSSGNSLSVWNKNYRLKWTKRLPRRSRGGGGEGTNRKWPSANYLVYVDAVVQRPHGLEVVLHPVLELAGHLVQGQEVFEVPPLALVQRPPGVHTLDDGRHVTEHHGMHQCCDHSVVLYNTSTGNSYRRVGLGVENYGVSIILSQRLKI